MNDALGLGSKLVEQSRRQVQAASAALVLAAVARVRDGGGRGDAICSDRDLPAADGVVVGVGHVAWRHEGVVNRNDHVAFNVGRAA